MATEHSHFTGDPFVELGVPSSATHEEVRRAFRRRARETHPDHRPNDPQAAQRFARLRAAYEEALERIKRGEREVPRPPRPPVEDPTVRRGRALTELEIAHRVHALRDPLALRRIMVRHGHRHLIGAALAGNPAFPTDALPALRASSEGHWTVDVALANRADLPDDLLLCIARYAREPAVGLAVVGNARAIGDTFDALVSGPVRLDSALENALAAHPDLSVAAAARLAGRHATAVSAVLRLIDRSDLPEELLQRLAAQSGRPLVAAAARDDLQRRGLTLPPQRDNQRSHRPLAGSWR